MDDTTGEAILDNHQEASSFGTAQLLSQLFLFVMTAGLSATVEFQHIVDRLRGGNQYAVWCGVGLQYTVMPAAGLCTVLLLQHAAADSFTPAMGITLLVLCCSPGGSYSTWWCSQWNADLALSVSMTTCSSILGILILPLHLLLTTQVAYGGQTAVLALIDFPALLVSLAVVVTAIAVGLTSAYVFDGTHGFHTTANRLGNTSGLCLVVLGLIMGRPHDSDDETTFVEEPTNGSSHHSSSLLSQPWSLYVAVALPCVIGLILPNYICRRWMRLSKPETVAVAIECCYQNK